MRHKLKIFLLLGILLTSIFNSSLVFADEKIITLEEAKELAHENSRELEKYELTIDKSKSKLYQAKDDYKDAKSSSYSLYLNEYLILQDRLEEGDTSVTERLSALEKKMDAVRNNSSSEKIASAKDKKRDAEDDYDDSKLNKENYAKQLDYLVEELYTNILTNEDNIDSLNKEYELGLLKLNIERKRLELGRSTRDKVNEIAIDVSNVNKSITQYKQILKTLKGSLNDILGREYDEELNLENFHVVSTIAPPAYNDLLKKITEAYAKIPQLERYIEKRKDDKDDANTKETNRGSELIEVEIKEKELELKDEKINLKEITNNLIKDLKSQQKVYQLAELEYNNALINFEQDKKRLDLGQISKLSYLESESILKNIANKKLVAGYDFYLTKKTAELAEQGIILGK